MLVDEVNDADRAWLDFEMEETQLKLDLSDALMLDLVMEVVRFIQARE